MMDFSAALILLKEGRLVARRGWNGAGMFIFLVRGSTFRVNRAPLLGIFPEGTEINYHAHVDMRTAQGTIVPWLCSQTDLLADDWVEVKGAEKRRTCTCDPGTICASCAGLTRGKVMATP